MAVEVAGPEPECLAVRGGSTPVVPLRHEGLGEQVVGHEKLRVGPDGRAGLLLGLVQLPLESQQD
jgi:hypothetical protein